MPTSSPSVLILAVTLAISAGAGTQPAPTTSAFNQYVTLTERRIDTEVRDRDRFLYIDTLPKPKRDAALRTLRTGSVVIEPLRTKNDTKKIDVPDGMVHH